MHSGGLGVVNVPVCKTKHYSTIFSTNHTERTARSRAEVLLQAQKWCKCCSLQTYCQRLPGVAQKHEILSGADWPKQVCGSIWLILAVFQFRPILTVEINASDFTVKPIFSSQCTGVYKPNRKSAEARENCSFQCNVFRSVQLFINNAYISRHQLLYFRMKIHPRLPVNSFTDVCVIYKM